MSRVNHHANVTVRMKGLGLGHYHKEDKKWEFIFLRGIPNHKLKIIVREYRHSLPAPIEHVFPIPENFEEISITTTNAAPHDSLYISKNFGHRTRVDDTRDARWLIDLEKLHEGPVKLKKASERTENPVKLTYLSISDAMLYTDTIFKNPYKITKNGEDHFTRVTAAWLGLDIEWKGKKSKTDIKFASPSGVLTDIPLVPDSDVSIYEIEINNDCCGAGAQHGVSDFHYYYDYLVKMNDTFEEHVAPNQPALTPPAAAFAAMFNLSEGGENECKHPDCCAKIIGELDGMSSLKEVV